MLNYQKPIWFLKCEVTKKVVHNYIIMKYLKRLVSILFARYFCNKRYMYNDIIMTQLKLLLTILNLVTFF